LTQIQPLREYKVDICDFGVIKYEFEFSEFFDRPIPSLCVTIFSSDENARAQPEIIRNAKPGEIQSFNLLASWTDIKEVISFLHKASCYISYINYIIYNMI